MNKFEIQEEIYKCSKCGLCKSVCPIYIATKNENLVPRGRFILLNKFFKEQSNNKFSKNFLKNADICLNCNKCKRFCPSDIDTVNILSQIKSEYGYKHSFLHFSTLYFLRLKINRLLNFHKFIPKVKLNKQEEKQKVAYFEGCYNKYIDPNDKIAAIKLINSTKYNVIKINSTCCGLPYLSDGELETFEKNKLKIIKSIPKDIKYIVCSCDSCFETLQTTFKSEPNIISKLILIEELLEQENIKLSITDSNTIFHKPINRTNENGMFYNNSKVINKKSSCTLMENFFRLKHPKVAKEIENTVFYKKEEIENKTIITTCNLAQWGLIKGIKRKKAKTKVFTIAEYLNSISKK